MANLEVWGAVGLLPKLVSHRMPEQSDKVRDEAHFRHVRSSFTKLN
jgi:hypothetical protein